MPVAPNRTRRGHGGGRPRKPNPRPCPDRSSSLLQLLIVYGMVLMLNLLIKFRLEYLYPIVLLIQEVHNLWKCSTLSSFFFLVITFSTDLTLYMVTQDQNWLFMIAGFFVWIQLVYSGENRFTFSTFMLACIILGLDTFVWNHYSKEKTYESVNFRPIAAHCIGYPIVSLGYCVKRYLAYLMRIRKQNEVETKNDFLIQLLHEALPPENYINPRVDPYTELPGDDQSSENTESDTVAEETEKEPTLFQKFKELLSDVACFTRPTTPFVQIIEPQKQSQVQSPERSRPNQSMWPNIGLPSLPSLFQVLSSFFTRNSSQVLINQQPRANSPSDIKPPSSPSPPDIKKSIKRGKEKRESPKGKDDPGVKSSHDGLRRRPGITNRPNTGEESIQEDTIQSKKLPISERITENMQIKPMQDEKQIDEKKELKKLQKEIKDKELVEAELRKKIKDLILHEDFTKEELENLQKRESQNKSQLQAERTRRQELEILLKKEEDLRKTKETLLADERRRNHNTSELEQAKLRIRQLEIERDGVREDFNKNHQKLQKLEISNNDLTIAYQQSQEKLRKTQEKLDEESRVKMNLFQQLSKAHQLENERRMSASSAYQSANRQSNSTQSVFDQHHSPTLNGSPAPNGYSSPNSFSSSQDIVDGFSSSYDNL